MIRAGKFRHYADIEHFVPTGTGKGDRGQPKGNWLAFLNDVPMSVEPIRGQLAEIKRQLVPEASHQIWMRWEAGIQAGMRVNYQGRLFRIGYVDEGDFLQHDLGLLCVEVAGETING